MIPNCNKIVVIGGSAGGIEAVANVISGLAPDIPAAFFVVLHLHASVPSQLAHVLGRRTALRVRPADDGLPIECGVVYTAPPDHHLLIENGVMRLGRGPRENNARPSVDPLFRTAAATYGSQVIGVVLSGNLDDGSAGLLEIERKGGTTVVQDPDEALCPGMPASALQEVPNVDYVLPVAEIANVITRLSGEEGKALASGTPTAPDIARGGERPLARDERNENEEGGERSVFGCPSCGGVLWELQDGEMTRYRCRTGHMFSDEALLAAQTENLETALWAALRALEEAEEQSSRIARRMRARAHPRLAERFTKQAEDANRRAAIVRRALMYNQGSRDQIQEVG